MNAHIVSYKESTGTVGNKLINCYQSSAQGLEQLICKPININRLGVLPCTPINNLGMGGKRERERGLGGTRERE